ncbi:MAG: UDP-glucose 4-epimerase GalE [Patescibacteria group bacterium]
MKILVTGGFGYIGSFMVQRLLEDNHEVVILDKVQKDLFSGRIKSYIGDLLDKKFVESVFSAESFDAVIHFAGFISMGESMEKPGKYFENNIVGALNILDAMVKHGIKKFVFSSTAGVYGNPTTTPIPEDHPKNPTNPYGESKYAVERLLEWYSQIHGISAVSLRYFNAAGASIDGQRGEDHASESHLIPRAISALLKDEDFMLFGDDYDTPDGTCVRDYIHVLDLAEAHMLALKKLDTQAGNFCYNVGTGKGYSNKDVLQMVEKISGQSIKTHIASRRAGDADILVADSSKIQTELGFSPKFSRLETIVESAWKYHSGKNA